MRIFASSPRLWTCLHSVACPRFCRLKSAHPLVLFRMKMVEQSMLNYAPEKKAFQAHSWSLPRFLLVHLHLNLRKVTLIMFAQRGCCTHALVASTHHINLLTYIASYTYTTNTKLTQSAKGSRSPTPPPHAASLSQGLVKLCSHTSCLLVHHTHAFVLDMLGAPICPSLPR
jgi:hypothetical protein